MQSNIRSGKRVDLSVDMTTRGNRMGMTFKKNAFSDPSASVATTFPVTVQALVPNGTAVWKVDPSGKAKLEI